MFFHALYNCSIIYSAEKTNVLKFSNLKTGFECLLTLLIRRNKTVTNEQLLSTSAGSQMTLGNLRILMYPLKEYAATKFSHDV